tara:strand:- start:6634 stop:6792 length:159 start_codon:yes stop_codon:yes gene_type:complete
MRDKQELLALIGILAVLSSMAFIHWQDVKVQPVVVDDDDSSDDDDSAEGSGE